MRILFEADGWRLLGWSSEDYTHKSYSEIQHHCNQPHGSKMWWYYAYDRVCGICHTDIPDEMIGLKLLYDWKR